MAQLRPTRRAFLAAAAVIPAAAAQTRGFVRAQGPDLIDAQGTKLLLKGISLGNWLVPEGYMFGFEKAPTSAREIAAFFNELIGPEEGARFWQQWRDAYIAEADIKLLRAQGFNSIRIPFDAALIPDPGFALLDRVIGWCRAAGLYVVLDMHCAPGGQTGTNIDNSWGWPWLWESAAEQDRTVAMWRDIASRYRDEPVVLGYDLLNEPIPNQPVLEKYNDRLEPLYKRIVRAARDVDTNHIVILGGAQWDTNFSVFGPPFDGNSMYTFHKYWMPPAKAQIQQYLDFRDRYRVPVWLGESGENTSDWVAQFRATLEENGVGWCFWPYKKLNAESCVATFDKPQHWDEIVAYAKARPASVGDLDRFKLRPSPDQCRAALADLLQRVRAENCRLNQSYVRALGLGTPS